MFDMAIITSIKLKNMQVNLWKGIEPPSQRGRCRRCMKNLPEAESKGILQLL
jgi:hypothetical protein